MSETQTPQGTQPQAEVQPSQDLNETEKLHEEAQQRIENEAKELMEPGVPPESPKQPEQPQQPENPASVPQEPGMPAPQTPGTPPVDYKQKFKDSAREVPVILERERQAQTRIEQLTNINITEDELRSLYPDWEQMNDTEKRAFRETALANKKANLAMNTAFNIMEQQAWAADFAKTLKANPALTGREEDFKAYCYKPTHKNVPIDVLVKSFLFDLPQAPASVPATPGLEKGSGGPRGDETPGEYTEEQLAQIRVSDPKRYRQILVNESRREAQRK